MIIEIESIVLISDTDYVKDKVLLNTNNIVYIVDSNVQRALVEKHHHITLDNIKKDNPNVKVCFIKMLDGAVIFAIEDYLYLMLRINKLYK